MSLMEKEMDFFIHSSQCDFNDNLKISAAFDYFQDLAGMHADEIGVGFEPTYALGYYWVIMYEQIEVVKRIPKFGDKIIVKTWPKPRGRLEFEREYAIYDENKDLLVKAISNWVLIDINRRTISKAENIKFNGEYVAYSNYEGKQKRRLNLPDNEFDSYYTYTVGIEDLDHNQHMNNTRYLNKILNMQSFDNYKKWKKCEIAFLHEARLNDTIKIGHYKDEEGIDCYKGYINDQLSFEVKLYLED